MDLKATLEMHLLYEVWPLKRISIEMKEFLSCAKVTPSSDILRRSNRKGRWTDEYCSFSEIIHIALPPPLAHRYIYLISISLTRCHDDDREWCQCQWKHCGGGRGRQLKKKARTIQSLSIRYFRCKMDIRVEIWQSVPALTGSSIDNDQWLGQWDVSVQAGKLIKWH